MFIAVTRCSLQQRVKSVRVEIHRDAGGWRHGEDISHSVLSKEGQRRRRSYFIMGVGAGKFLGCEGFCPNFTKLTRKVFCATFACTFSPTKIIKISFWCNLQKKSSCVFMQTLGAIFWSQTTLGANFSRLFRAFVQIFSK